MNTKTCSIQMTTGSLWKNILLFSLPLMMTQVLEVLFNLSDVAIAGKFADYIALGAVGSTTLLVSLFTGFLIGMGAGVNVRAAHRLGAGDDEGVRMTVHSSLLVCGIIGVIVCLVCLFLAEPMLTLLRTKSELITEAVTYLRIYSLGMPAMAVYNFGSGILSACGETKRPLIYLSIAGALNVALNLFFVICCGMAASGVAAASVISQYLSAGLIVVHLVRRRDCCALRPSRKYISRKACADVLMLGIPAGIQNAVFAVANLFVQTGVNHFDAITVSGNSAAANADAIIFNVQAAIHTACASFISRNRGAGNHSRMMKSYAVSLTYSFAAGAILGGLLMLFGRGVPVAVRERRGGNKRRNGAALHNGLELPHRRLHGLHHSRRPRDRQDSSPDHHGDNGLLRVPGGVGVHYIRALPDDNVAVPAVQLLMGDNRRGGDSVLPAREPEMQVRGR